MVVSHGEMHKDEENSTGELKALNTPTPDHTNGQAIYTPVTTIVDAPVNEPARWLSATMSGVAEAGAPFVTLHVLTGAQFDPATGRNDGGQQAHDTVAAVQRDEAERRTSEDTLEDTPEKVHVPWPIHHRVPALRHQTRRHGRNAE